ncbi:hypothetical protein [Nonomuraea sp. NPDC049400]|uniref:hypothetical protein n=1 Tax=Nonomuraea sp. NPDC049400 TaxID=3364352 RepID=UPI0037B83FA7
MSSPLAAHATLESINRVSLKSAGTMPRLRQNASLTRFADDHSALPGVADELTARPGLTHRFELGLVGILGELDRKRLE